MKIKLAVSALLGFGCPLALASDGDGRPAKKKPEWVFTLYSGRSKTDDSDLSIRIPGDNTSLTYQNVRWDDKSLEMPLYYGNRITYWPSNQARFGFSAEFFHHKVYIDPDQVTQVTGTLKGAPHDVVEPIGNTLPYFSISNGINYVILSVIARQRSQVSERYPSGRIQPYAGVGYGLVIPHSESRIGSDTNGRYRTDGWSWQLFGGMEYRMSPDWGLFLEYRYTDYRASVEVARDGTAKARFQSDHLVIGTSYRPW